MCSHGVYAQNNGSQQTSDALPIVCLITCCVYIHHPGSRPPPFTRVPRGAIKLPGGALLVLSHDPGVALPYDLLECVFLSCSHMNQVLLFMYNLLVLLCDEGCSFLIFCKYSHTKCCSLCLAFTLLCPVQIQKTWVICAQVHCCWAWQQWQRVFQGGVCARCGCSCAVVSLELPKVM